MATYLLGYGIGSSSVKAALVDAQMSWRWHGLVRTGLLVRHIQAWNPEAAPYSKDFSMLRPIPQIQIDRVIDGPKFPKSPGC